jgi:DNA-binding NarL/FixJ family response regulator
VRFACVLEVIGDEVVIRLPLKQADRLIDIPRRLVLTPRQNEIMALLSQNKQNKEIAEALQITERTVKFHVSNLLRKLQIENRHGVHTLGRIQ